MEGQIQWVVKTTHSENAVLNAEGQDERFLMKKVKDEETGEFVDHPQEGGYTG